MFLIPKKQFYWGGKKTNTGHYCNQWTLKKRIRLPTGIGKNLASVNNPVFKTSTREI